MLDDYIWKISSLDCEINNKLGNNFVKVVNWSVEGTYNGVFGKIPGKTKFVCSDDQTDFIPFELLTEEIVLNWVWNSHIDKNVIERHLDTHLHDKVFPKVKTTELPWNNKN